MDLLNFFFNLHQIMYSFGKQTEKNWGEGHFKVFHGIVLQYSVLSTQYDCCQVSEI